ncbi:hypothetical protein H4696_001016 [Amycolatopsis lexingtonensis]|uniref:Uncharacterized protein n=1 Tax=Amycolatopsis lexingtonensis TaxID=218822 RepID=A0ABR9HSL5_9PSEU|nr:hypothetical protein [Amycolatopsis lexingtonensis]MBE1493916.1 hypothetical protein [Amycolatopsis lexingtonensis]
MDDKEKAVIEAEARRDVAERGRHGPKVGRYLHAVEHHAVKENEQDVVPVVAEDLPQPAEGRQP